jgi:hypothetical protein
MLLAIPPMLPAADRKIGADFTKPNEAPYEVKLASGNIAAFLEENKEDLIKERSYGLNGIL